MLFLFVFPTKEHDSGFSNTILNSLISENQLNSCPQSSISLTLQPGPEGKDASILIRSNGTQYSTGTGSVMEISAYRPFHRETQRGLIEFDLQSIPEYAIIDSAKLFLYAGGSHDNNPDNACWVERIIAPWDESTVTWNSQPTTTTENRVEIPTSASTDEDFILDISAMIQDMMNDEENSHGFKIKLKDESSFRGMFFYTSDYTGDIMKRPKLELTYKPRAVSESQIAICQGENYLFDGIQLNQTGIYFDTLITTDGCDSLNVLMLSVQDTFHTEIGQTICLGKTINFNNQDIGIAGIYRDTITAINGCDSFIVLTLTVDTIQTKILEVICLGNSFSFNGQSLTTSGLYIDTLSTIEGCDSFINLNLYVDSLIKETKGLFCPGDNYFFNNQNLTEPGTYLDTFITAIGCDSFLILRLAHFSAGTIGSDRYICNNENLFPSNLLRELAKATGENNVYQWQSSQDSINFQDIIGATNKEYNPEPITATTFFRRIVSFNSNQCTNTTNVVTIPFYPELKLCSNEATQIVLESTVLIKREIEDKYGHDGDLNQTDPGVYIFTTPNTIDSLNITTIGADGGRYNTFGYGGSGATINGKFSAIQGRVLKLMVGESGKTHGSTSKGGGGGGGGSGVIINEGLSIRDILLLAGGGGGASSGLGIGGSAETYGKKGDGSAGNNDGNGGNGGALINFGSVGGGGGGGFLNEGQDGFGEQQHGIIGKAGGRGFNALGGEGLGETDGGRGFGGGGSGAIAGFSRSGGGGGGGGGFSGGDGSGTHSPGGGGGSYIDIDRNGKDDGASNKMEGVDGAALIEMEQLL